MRWGHEIRISKITQFHFFENKNFWSEIKSFFQVLQVLNFRLEKQNSKNSADTAFNSENIWHFY